ncbi:MAG TPA: hypothetical protein VFG03_10970, partial [Telluria sp.]|nr:hypothetical protein [Telluria sp.]
AAMLLTIARNAPVQSMLKAIASGVLGAAAFKGGEETALLGLGLHFLIMLGIALAYWWLVSGTLLARAQPLVAGALFGAAVYAAMNLLVLPLSRIAFVPHYPPMTLVRDIAIHIACVGIPIALVMKTMLRR